MGIAVAHYSVGDPEELADIIKASAQDMFRKIAENLTATRLDELATGLGVENNTLERIKSRLVKAMEFAG